MISAVGTYYASENENYTIEIYVNDELKHLQNETAPYYDYHTVKLTEELTAIDPLTNYLNYLINTLFTGLSSS